MKGFIESDSQNYGYKMTVLTSHVEGRAIDKFYFFFSCLFRLLTTFNISLVHIHTACDTSFYRKAVFALSCKLRGIPVVMHIHGADFDSYYNSSNSFIKAIVRVTLKRCDRVLVLSKFWKSFFETTLALTNVEVLYNAVNCSNFENCYTSPRNIRNFLFLGRLGERKGTYDLIKSIDILVKLKGHTDLKFYLAGDGEVEQVSELVKTLGLSEYVDVLGWIDDKMKIEVLKKADTVLLPSYNEGLPVALLEAMASGKVIVSTYVGGIPDLVEQDVNGFLLQPGDVNQLTYYIEKIIANPLLVERIGKVNVIKIQENFNTIAINKQLFSLYDILIKN